MLSKLIILLLLAILPLSKADGPLFAKNWDWDKFVGKWHLYKKGPEADPVEFRRIECAEETYTRNPTNKFVIDYTLSMRDKFAKNMSISRGWAVMTPLQSSRAVIYASNNAIPVNFIATDYNSWALLSTTEKQAGANVKVHWILSRSPTLPAPVLSTIETFIESFGGNPRTMLTYQNVNCPKPVQGSPGAARKSPDDDKVKPSTPPPAGGVGSEQKATAEVKALVKKVTPAIVRKITEVQGKPLKEVKSGEQFEVLSFKSQIVAGKNYFIKVKVLGENDQKIWHLRVHEHWSGTPVELVNVTGPKDAQHPLEYFN